MADPAAHRDRGERRGKPAVGGQRQDFAISRDWTLPLLPWPAETRQRYQMLAPGQEMSLAPAELAGLDRANLQGCSASGTPLGSGSPVAGAGRLPYACLEQTVPCLALLC